MIAWVENGSGSEAMGPAPDGWTVEQFPDAPASAPDLEDVEFVVAGWPASKLREVPNLKGVQTRSAVVDWIVEHVPDGVTLCSAKGARDPAMAEWVLWAILADYKAAGVAAAQQAAREWEHLDLRDIEGASVLILGHGSIGVDRSKAWLREASVGRPWRRSTSFSVETCSAGRRVVTTPRRRSSGEITHSGTRKPRPYASTCGGRTWS